MLTPTCYEALGISENATPADIKKAYYKKSLELHPDRTNGNKDKEEQFKQANIAYEILSDEKLHALYDQVRKSTSEEEARQIVFQSKQQENFERQRKAEEAERTQTKAQATTQQATKPEVPKTEIPKPKEPKSSAPKPQTPRPHTPKPQAAKSEAPKPQATPAQSFSRQDSPQSRSQEYQTPYSNRATSTTPQAETHRTNSFKKQFYVTKEKAPFSEFKIHTQFFAAKPSAYLQKQAKLDRELELAISKVIFIALLRQEELEKQSAILAFLIIQASLQANLSHSHSQVKTCASEVAHENYADERPRMRMR